ncbi:MAG TPA: AI-2E family transporter [Planctomycetaceae bacterium]|nr:AI-2E family transporter [Planctomycetaceae bacterium]
MARLVSLGILVLLIVILGIMFYNVIAPFMLPVFLAGVVSLLFRPLYRKLLEKTGDRATWAAGLTTAAALATFLIPLTLGIIFATGELWDLGRELRESPEVRAQIRKVRSEKWLIDLVHVIQPLLGPDVDERRIVDEIQNWTQQAINEIGTRTLGAAGAALQRVGALFSMLISAGMFVIALYYFLCDGPRLLLGAQNLIPVKTDYQKQLFIQFEKSVRAVVTSTFIAALAQGFFTTIALYFLGFERFFLLFILSTLLAMIPLAGTWFVWIPCAVWLAYSGSWGSAIFLTLYGIFFIGLLDNGIRTYILHTDVKLHPLLAFISVLGGVQAMGLWGVFIAPIVASCLHALIQIFNTELKEISQEQFKELRQKYLERPAKKETPDSKSQESDASPAETPPATKDEKSPSASKQSPSTTKSKKKR